MFFNKGKYIWFIILFVVIIFLFFIDLLTGSVSINIHDTISILLSGYDSHNYLSVIFYDIRIPRILTAVSAGIALAVSGLLMQTLFRNPLAGPDVLGVSSGAGLGVALLILGFSAFGINVSQVLGDGGLIVSACMGSGLFMVIIFMVSIRVKDVMTLLVLGILLGAAASAIINVFQYAGSEQSLKLFVLWTMGSLSNTTWSQWTIMSVVIFAGVVIAFITAYSLNVWLLGEESAKTSGVNTNRVRNLLFLSTILLAGSVTAFCGPLAFIGIAAPHLARVLIKTSDHRWLIPLSGLVGVIMLLTADILSQLPSSDIILPINVTTSLLGIPIVFWIVIKGKRMWS
jgi:iron complex transport system permease protein